MARHGTSEEEPPPPDLDLVPYGIRVLAVMLFPRDESVRLQWFASAMAGFYSEHREAGGTAEALAERHDWIRFLWAVRQSPKRVFSDGLKRCRRGATSGALLETLLQLAVHHPRHFELQRAIALIEDATSESLAKKAWAEFKRVSHLWAAFTWSTETGEAPKDVDDAPAGWETMLCVAESYRLLAERHSVFGRGEAWRHTSPEWLRFAEPHAADLASILQKRILPLSPEALDLLDRDFPAAK